MNRRQALLAALAITAYACKPGAPGGDAPGGEAAGGAPPPMPVDVLTLAEKPVRDTSEYLATLASRTSVALYPQVTGRVSKILVKPGDKVRAGAELVQIDPGQQQATLDQLVATKRLKEANLRLAEDRETRAAALADGGLVSAQTYQEAVSGKAAAAADLAASDAQIRAQSTELRFFRVTAPFAGTVGDIPVKLGELVTTATQVTTVDQNAALEAYVNVPVERTKDITPGTIIELLDERGVVVGSSPVTFVADHATLETQSVLVKGAFSGAGAFTPAQIVKARVVWSVRPGLLLPVIAVTRKSGQTFAFVAVPEGAGEIAKQRAVTLGAIQGNDYVVASGLKAGERVILSAIQKIREGAPVTPVTPNAPKG
jgi:RND family efflux transporter MFP subunit